MFSKVIIVRDKLSVLLVVRIDRLQAFIWVYNRCKQITVCRTAPYHILTFPIPRLKLFAKNHHDLFFDFLLFASKLLQCVHRDSNQARILATQNFRKSQSHCLPMSANALIQGAQLCKNVVFVTSRTLRLFLKNGMTCCAGITSLK